MNIKLVDVITAEGSSLRYFFIRQSAWVQTQASPGDRLSSQTRVTRQILKQFADANLNLV